VAVGIKISLLDPDVVLFGTWILIFQMSLSSIVHMVMARSSETI